MGTLGRLSWMLSDQPYPIKLNLGPYAYNTLLGVFSKWLVSD